MKTAEEILIKYETYINQNHTPIVYRDHALKAMEEYASQFKTVEPTIEICQSDLRGVNGTEKLPELAKSIDINEIGLGKTLEPEKRAELLKEIVYETEKNNTEFKCHGCGETHTGKNDDQLYEICKSCFDRI